MDNGDNKRQIAADLIQHTMNRCGQIVNDSAELLESEEDIMHLYIAVAMAAMHGLIGALSEVSPLLNQAPKDLQHNLVIGMMCAANDYVRPPMSRTQYLSDSAAIGAELLPWFRFKIEFADERA